MADLRCRWCGQWLNPDTLDNGDPYCSPEHAVTSLERHYDAPSIAPAERPDATLVPHHKDS